MSGVAFMPNCTIVSLKMPHELETVETPLEAGPGFGVRWRGDARWVKREVQDASRFYLSGWASYCAHPLAAPLLANGIVFPADSFARGRGVSRGISVGFGS